MKFYTGDGMRYSLGARKLKPEELSETTADDVVYEVTDVLLAGLGAHDEVVERVEAFGLMEKTDEALEEAIELQAVGSEIGLRLNAIALVLLEYHHELALLERDPSVTTPLVQALAHVYIQLLGLHEPDDAIAFVGLSDVMITELMTDDVRAFLGGSAEQ